MIAKYNKRAIIITLLSFSVINLYSQITSIIQNSQNKSILITWESVVKPGVKHKYTCDHTALVYSYLNTIKTSRNSCKSGMVSIG